MLFRFFRVPAVIASVLFLTSAAIADEFPQINTSRPMAMPVYPEAAQRTGVTGTTIVAVHVNEIGKPFVVQTATSSGSPALDQAAVNAVSRWRFIAAEKDGVAAAEWTAIGFSFGADGVKQIPVSPDTEIAREYRNRQICRPQPPATGSHLPNPPLCLAKWQWDERARKAKMESWRFPNVQGGGAKSPGR
jgi:TonB family protein